MNYENAQYGPYQGQNMQANYKRIPTPEFLEAAYNNTPFINQNYAPPAPYGYINIHDDIE